MSGVGRRASTLLSEALCAEDAEEAGADSQLLVADPASAIAALGAPDAREVDRNAVVQRFGGVGALLVVACEEHWAREHGGMARDEDVLDEVPHALASELGRLLSGFAHMEPSEMDGLVESIEGLDGQFPIADEAAARRWLNVTYAVAARDGSEESHRAYVRALDRLLALKRELVSI
ncbi:MAG TPA: hypothetical protein VMR97_00130 [Acidimicrobiales bacterium]|nr:hypothetical protein [Acidimicrobiales bacterium]